MRWKYLLTATAQGKMWGSKRKPDWLEMFLKFSELKLLSDHMGNIFAISESEGYYLTKNWSESAYLGYLK